LQFFTISGWKDADEQVYTCKKRIEEIKANDEAEAKRYKKNVIIILIVCMFLVLGVILNAAFSSINRYLAIDKYGEAFVETFESLEVGDTYIYGNYEQDNNTTNGKEGIRWIVLEKHDGKALLVSQYGLECKQYNEDGVATWETCTLRKWLNDDFINAAFSESEKALIPNVTVKAHSNPEYNTNPGKSTKDRVFLLSIAEANTYFESNSARQCMVTDYAIANCDFESQIKRYCSGWWLRSPGKSPGRAATVRAYGEVDTFGKTVLQNAYPVRPAIWIDLNY